MRVTNLAKRLNITLVWIVKCIVVKLTEQEKFYANRRGSGTPFFRHAELNQLGIPVLAGIYGTNPAGGGYQGISPTILFAHKNCNIAVGGGGILSGMSPKGFLDEEGAEQLIASAKQYKVKPPGSVEIHYDDTGRPKPKTAHSLNPVPVYIYDTDGNANIRLSNPKDPGISNLAATCLTLLGFEPPKDYTPSIIAVG